MFSGAYVTKAIPKEVTNKLNTEDKQMLSK